MVCRYVIVWIPLADGAVHGVRVFIAHQVLQKLAPQDIRYYLVMEMWQ